MTTLEDRDNAVLAQTTLHRGTRLAAAITLNLACCFASLAQTSAPLLHESDLEYEGAFRLPGGGSETTTFEYGGTALFFHTANNSLFIAGHPYHQRTAEVAVPSPGSGGSIGSLPTGSFVQSFADATGGRLSTVNPSDPNEEAIGGHLVYDGNLYISGYSTYDAGGTQNKSHFVRPISLSSGSVQGPYRLGQDPHFTSGYMTLIPQAWRSLLGGPALAGNCCLSITSVQSNGPSVSVFDPSDLDSGDASAEMLLGYPFPLVLGPGETTQNPYFNLTTKIRGVVFPEGTSSILFIGRHGTGPYCYGEADECGDPVTDYKGGHAYPYEYQIWAYDANDLLDVKNGSRDPHELMPYDVWNFELPFSAQNNHSIGGAAYDPGTGRIFISQMNNSGGESPLIHVFTVDSSPRPVAPVALQAN